MFAIYKRELFSFLNSSAGYITIGVFLLSTGILLWVLPDTSILDYGYAELSGFFSLAPFLFMFLIPAVCMSKFAEERKEGTYLLLATRPVTSWQIIYAKYFACLTWLCIALIPTIVYYFSIIQLTMPTMEVDHGAVIGAYVGLFLLGASFTAIGLFASAITSNQVVAFVIGVFICFLLFTGLEAAAKIPVFVNIETTIEDLGINAHYQSISRGVLDTRDLVYFFSVSAVFLGLTRLIIGARKW